MLLALTHVDDLHQFVGPHVEIIRVQRAQLEYPGHTFKVDVEPIFLALLEGHCTLHMVKVDHALRLVLLLVVLVVVQTHVFHHEIAGLLKVKF